MNRQQAISKALKGLGSNVKNMKGNPRGPVSKNLKVQPHASLYPGGRKVPGVDQPFVTQSQPIAKKPKAEAVEFHPIAVVPKGTPIHINVGGTGVSGNKPVGTQPPRYLTNRKRHRRVPFGKGYVEEITGPLKPGEKHR